MRELTEQEAWEYRGCLLAAADRAYHAEYNDARTAYEEAVREAAGTYSRRVAKAKQARRIATREADGWYYEWGRTVRGAEPQ